jgi:hypothetical protein
MTSSSKQHEHVIGVISDTHGLLRPEVSAALQGSGLIIHAGDIGSPEVLERLREIARVVAVRGNTDTGLWASILPVAEVVQVAGIDLYVLHDINDLDLDPGAAGFRVVISGHSHRPGITHRSDVMFLNPGSAGPRRFNLPVSLARLLISDRQLDAEIVELSV